jgi:hypothetical protein
MPPASRRHANVDDVQILFFFFPLSVGNYAAKSCINQYLHICRSTSVGTISVGSSNTGYFRCLFLDYCSNYWFCERITAVTRDI